MVCISCILDIALLYGRRHRGGQQADRAWPNGLRATGKATHRRVTTRGRDTGPGPTIGESEEDNSSDNLFILRSTPFRFSDLILKMDVANNNELIPIPSGILDDLSSRFIINVPDEERKDLTRICFQIELAHWYYLDFYCNKVESVLDEWKTYKMTVPTYGAILMDSSLEKVVLVQGYWAKSSWGFPKGKVNAEEEAHICAIREVLEETGFDMSKLINKDEYLEHSMNDQVIRLYIITGVPNDTKFQPKTRNEIKSVEWFSISDLPLNKKDVTSKTNLGMAPNSFFTVMPFVRPLRQWIQMQQKKCRRQRTKTVDVTPSHGLIKKQTNHFPSEMVVTIKAKDGRQGSRMSSPPPRLQKQKDAKNQQYQVKDNSHVRRVLSQTTDDENEFNLIAPSWLSFTFDRQTIISAAFT
uniref:mRNA-decapping enzyme 2 n=1 Tax=Strigamia maritima TaxID=126957 RepID=T1IWP2_STRMM